MASASGTGRLIGKVAIVTGASSGIGAATAVALAREGAHVALAARRTDALERIKESISGHGGNILVCTTDVTNKQDVGAMVKRVTEELGPVDILVCAAGVMYYTLMANALSDQWDHMVDVNCKGVMYSIASAVPGMLARKTGHVVAISSDAGRRIFCGLGVYSATKFFVEAALQTLRLETVRSGLRVTSVQPGSAETELFGLSTDQEAVQKYGQMTGAKILDAEDVAEAVIYAVCAPEQVGVNEILIQPKDEPM